MLVKLFKRNRIIFLGKNTEEKFLKKKKDFEIKVLFEFIVNLNSYVLSMEKYQDKPLVILRF